MMAAALVLLLGIGWVLYQNQAENWQELAQNEQIFNTFFSADLKPALRIAAHVDRVAASPENSYSTQD